MYSPHRDPPILLAVPNASEGRDPAAIDALAAAFAAAEGSVRLLDVHADPDHHRSVFSLGGRQGELADALVRGARAAIEWIDLTSHDGLHPRIGALDVAPVVFLDDDARGAACAEALTAAALIGGELGLPVFLYGDLATAPERRERAALRRGGPVELGRRLAARELRPDYGPARLHPTAGGLLVTARPPLIAFNLDLASDDLELARRIAATLRESGGGLPGVRAIGLRLPARGCVQVSTNVHDHRAVPLREIVAAVRAHAGVAEAELVGLAPATAFDGFPDDVPLRDFGPHRLIESAVADALRSSA